VSETTPTTSSQPEDRVFLLGSINIALKEDLLHQKSCAFLAMQPQEIGFPSGDELRVFRANSRKMVFPSNRLKERENPGCFQQILVPIMNRDCCAPNQLGDGRAVFKAETPHSTGHFFVKY
jgi:hypothetical protein